MPAVSIVIPAHNPGDHLRPAIASVHGQSFDDWDLTVVDDASTEDLSWVPVEFPRARLVRQPHGGVAVARNRGVAEGAGELVAFLDDDDVWPADNLARHVAALGREPDAVLSYGTVETFPQPKSFDHPLQFADRSATAELLGGNIIVSPGQVVVRRRAVAAVNGFDPALWGTDDWDLYLRLARLGPFAFTGGLALRYRLHGANASRQRCRMFVNTAVLYRKHRPTDPAERHAWRAGRRRVLGLSLRFAVDECCDLWRDGHRAAAARRLLTVGRHRPSLALSRSVARQLWQTVAGRGGRP